MCFCYCVFRISHLFDPVGVDCSLGLEYTDWLRFLGALRHLAHFLCNEVVDAIEGFDCTLNQTDTFCCSCSKTRKGFCYSMCSDRALEMDL